MGIARKYIEKQATQRVPAPILDAAGKALIEGIDRAVVSRWDRAIEEARTVAPGAAPAVKARQIATPIRKRMTALGAAAGATAAAPGIGTSVAVGTLAAELGVVALKTTDMVMSIGAAYGHLNASPEERRAWVLAVLAFGDDAAEEFATLARDLGMNVSSGQAIEVAGEAIGGGAGQMATVDALRRINTTLVAQVLKKWGTRRGAATVGKLLPFGIGAAVGGSANYVMMREFAKQASRFFDSYDRDFVLGMAPQDVVSRADTIDVTGRRIDDASPSGVQDYPPPPPPGATPTR